MDRRFFDNVLKTEVEVIERDFGFRNTRSFRIHFAGTFIDIPCIERGAGTDAFERLLRRNTAQA